jgi:hypothetical protein
VAQYDVARVTRYEKGYEELREDVFAASRATDYWPDYLTKVR